MGRKTRGPIAVFALTVWVALGIVPARADSVPGTIMLPTLTSPGAARILYSETGSNGVVGHVFKLVKTSGNFTLRSVAGMTGQEDFDIQFYESVDAGTTAGDTQCTEAIVVCTRPIPAKAKWAVVVMSVGLNGAFVYSS